jgi:micrococcal nuclease
MQILRVLTMVVVAANATDQSAVRPEVVAVRTVVDGNTIDVAGYGRVRLAGVRAPRPGRGGLDGEPFAREARERLEGIVTHRFVRLEFPSVWSRSAAYVLLEDGTFVNALLVREGLARLAGRPAGARGEDLQRAQQQAMGARRGIWGARDQLHNSQRHNSRRTPNLQLPKRPSQERKKSEGPIPVSYLGSFGRSELGIAWELGIVALWS